MTNYGLAVTFNFTAAIVQKKNVHQRKKMEEEHEKFTKSMIRGPSLQKPKR